CLLWLADALGVTPPVAPTPTVEEHLLVPLLVEGARRTFPIWRLSAHMVALNTRAVRKEAFDLFDRVVWRVLPSEKAFEVVRSAMQAVPPDGVVTGGVEMASLAEPDIGAVASKREWIEPVLSLCLLLSMSDGKFSRDEERFYHAVAEGIGVSVDNANALRD